MLLYIGQFYVKHKTTKKRKLQSTKLYRKNMVKSHRSRKRVSLLLKQAKETFKEGREYTQLFISRAAKATDELLRQVHYQQLIEEAEEQVEDYLKEIES